MSNHSKSARFVVALAGALIVVAATWRVRHADDATRIEASRSIASLRIDSAKRARLETHDTAKNENKAKGSFNLAITADDGLGGAIEATSVAATRVHLKGLMTAEKHIASHDFTWILPPNYKLIDGAMSGTIPELRPGQTHEVRITVDRGSEPIQPIVWHVFKMINSEPRGQVAQFDISDPTKITTQGTDKSSAHLRDEKFVQ